ncbi:cupin domain-containing protein [Desulfofustis limnaeus]|jgi:quercetin dioxygenase-like cupin family protein|uniref:Cupin n=1 Tax=Desulfofustis limnaeus TaxID=2740163 RepID=A0ABN6M6R9_9BACT|nr:cupin domain-containing protein [Desulfofustis limnaeus]MDX9895381.1 cupin domain-containing protein [Desulfofustis sp.]BDD87744.1 cupin [Desulfofustis limnaeus]
MIGRADEKGFRQLLPGIQQRTPVFGTQMLLAEFRLAKDAILPLHNHPHEQIGYLVSGRLRFTIGGEVTLVAAGDSWCVPGGVEHGVEVLDDAVVVEVFAPVREDYLPDAGQRR